MVADLYTARQVTLMLYKAAELQDLTWWLRSVRLAQRLPKAEGNRYGLDEIQQIALEMGIDRNCVQEASEMITDAWDVT